MFFREESFGVQFSFFLASSPPAVTIPGSPDLLLTILYLILRPSIFLVSLIISKTEWPNPVPRLRVIFFLFSNKYEIYQKKKIIICRPDGTGFGHSVLYLI